MDCTIETKKRQLLPPSSSDLEHLKPWPPEQGRNMSSRSNRSDEDFSNPVWKVSSSLGADHPAFFVLLTAPKVGLVRSLKLSSSAARCVVAAPHLIPVVEGCVSTFVLSSSSPKHMTSSMYAGVATSTCLEITTTPGKRFVKDEEEGQNA